MNQPKKSLIAEIIEAVDHRASFGAIVTPTLEEMTQEEISEIYEIASNPVLNSDGKNPCELHYFKKYGNRLVCEKCGREIATR